ncbi:hypothetical protein Syun_016671 [Stephania yunnanensis]|uniref:Uncharacterized protein n=1 Tax=Stephania yunnanensis TaxID=152371 RepID=A0AAP0J5I6_9MAGN
MIVTGSDLYTDSTFYGGCSTSRLRSSYNTCRDSHLPRFPRYQWTSSFRDTGKESYKFCCSTEDVDSYAPTHDYSADACYYIEICFGPKTEDVEEILEVPTRFLLRRR